MREAKGKRPEGGCEGDCGEGLHREKEIVRDRERERERERERAQKKGRERERETKRGREGERVCVR